MLIMDEQILGFGKCLQNHPIGENTTDIKWIQHPIRLNDYSDERQRLLPFNGTKTLIRTQIGYETKLWSKPSIIFWLLYQPISLETKNWLETVYSNNLALVIKYVKKWRYQNVNQLPKIYKIKYLSTK